MLPRPCRAFCDRVGFFWSERVRASSRAKRLSREARDLANGVRPHLPEFVIPTREKSETGGIYWRTQENLNHSCPHPPQKIFSLAFRLFHHLGLSPILECNLLQHQLHRVLRLESLRDEFSNLRRKSFVQHRSQSRQMVAALMFFEFRSCKTVVCGLGVRIRQQRRQRIIPLALRTRPSLECAMRGPDQLASSFLLETSMIRTAGFHEFHDSRTKRLRGP